STEAISVPAKIGTLSMPLTARVLEIDGYDVILGIDWFRQWNPQVNWQTGTLTINEHISRSHAPAQSSLVHVLQSHTSSGFVDTPPALNAVDLLRRREEIEEAGTGVLWLMKQTPPDVSTTLPHSEDTGLRTLLREFHHRFTSELPDHLPPSRLHNHKIPTGDA